MKLKHWKFLHKGFKSASGDTKWKIGEWATPIKNIELCEQGYHCSNRIYQAFSYVQGPILAEVECKGKHQAEDDKEVWQSMRIVKAYKWTKKDSVALAIFSAELCLHNFEKVYPNDKRPREAIEAAKRFLKYPTAVNRSAKSAAWSAKWAAESAAESAWPAAWSAWPAAESAWPAAWSAWPAAWSAKSAKWAAESAAESAAWSAKWAAKWAAESAAESAAWSAKWAAESAAESAAKSAKSAAWSAKWAAESAAWSAWPAAESAIVKQISDWMDKRLLVLKEIE